MNAPAITRFDGPYRFLSNFFPSPLKVGPFTVPTAEHAYQIMKTLDPVEQEYIAQATSPGQAKVRGQEVTKRAGWETSWRELAMERVVHAKFKNEELAQKLRETGTAQLVEGNHWHDTFWGVCTCTLHKGVGLNTLGKLLMVERDNLTDNGPVRAREVFREVTGMDLDTQDESVRQTWLDFVRNNDITPR